MNSESTFYENLITIGRQIVKKHFIDEQKRIRESKIYVSKNLTQNEFLNAPIAVFEKYLRFYFNRTINKLVLPDTLLQKEIFERLWDVLWELVLCITEGKLSRAAEIIGWEKHGRQDVERLLENEQDLDHELFAVNRTWLIPDALSIGLREEYGLREQARTAFERGIDDVVALDKPAGLRKAPADAKDKAGTLSSI
jgi:hypothetical protein